MTELRIPRLRLLWRVPLWVAHTLADRFLWPWTAVLSGGRWRGRPKTVGRPLLRFASGSITTVGENVVLFSRRTSNPLVLARPCTFTVSSGAVLSVGNNCAFSGTVIVARKEVVIGNRVMVGANSTIVDTDFHPLDADQRRLHPTQGAKAATVRIADDVFIGMNVLILKGTVIGERSVVGAGAVVAGTFPADSVIAGNPARVLKARGQSLA